jgi:hypothetical protein
VRLAAPFGVRVHLTPQGAPQSAPLPRSGLARVDPGTQPVGAAAEAAAAGGVPAPKPCGGALASGSGGRAMTWGEALGFLRRQHAGFQALVAALESGHRSDHLALLRLAFARAASTGTAAAAAGAGPASTAVGGASPGPASTGLWCGGSACLPLPLAAELERTPAVPLALGPAVAACLVQALRDRAASVAVVPCGYRGAAPLEEVRACQPLIFVLFKKKRAACVSFSL